MIRRALLSCVCVALALSAASVLGGCNTVRGMADDVKAVADYTDKAMTGDVN